MKHVIIYTTVLVLCLLTFTRCGKESPTPIQPETDQTVIPGCAGMTLGTLAKVFAQLPLEEEHLQEVHRAAISSLSNGYDEEYTLHQLLNAPGCGVGETPTKATSPERPLRDLLFDYFSSQSATKSGVRDAQELLNALSESEVQIYWPFSEDWDGTYPIITFDPGYNSEYNYGYMIEKTEEGLHVIDSVFVDEEVARAHAVWVINTNVDASHTPANFFIPATGESASAATGTDDSASPYSIPRRLMFKSITMLRHYDPWYRGGSEFWVKCGAVNGFSASTEAELRLYSPSVTDFMVVVPRKYLDQKLEMNSIILTDFTNQMDNLAFLITEDDGGTQSSWKCSATVKIKSKSYGFDVDIPYNEKDDIVWRGQLSASFFQSEDVVSGRFGDVVLEFALE